MIGKQRKQKGQESNSLPKDAQPHIANLGLGEAAGPLGQLLTKFGSTDPKLLIACFVDFVTRSDDLENENGNRLADEDEGLALFNECFEPLQLTISLEDFQKFTSAPLSGALDGLLDYMPNKTPTDVVTKMAMRKTMRSIKNKLPGGA